MCRRLVALALFLGLPFTHACALADLEATTRTVAKETVLERFPIAKNAYSLVVPVEVEGKRYLFLLDTGASYTVYDKRLRYLLGEQLRRLQVETPFGRCTMPIYQAPEAKMGKLSLAQNAPVGVADLEIMRQVGDEEIYGILGMDNLSKYVLRIDFDRLEVVFLRSLGPEPGERLNLSFRFGLPHVPIRFAGADHSELFLLDTGMRGHDSGDLKTEFFDKLNRKKKMSSMVELRTVGLPGTVRSSWQGKIESLSFANHRHEQLVFTRSQTNLLSLRFCSRYVMSFDFPMQALYLKKSRRFDLPDKQNKSGLHILRSQGETRVEEVDRGSPAAVAGVKPGDILVKLDGESMDTKALYVVRERFCAEGKRIRLLLRRESHEREVSFILPKAEQ